MQKVNLYERHVQSFSSSLSLLLSSSLITLFKHLLVLKRLASQSQTSCGTSLGKGAWCLYKLSRSHTKMLAVSIKRKQSLKSPEPKDLGSLNFACSVLAVQRGCLHLPRAEDNVYGDVF